MAYKVRGVENVIGAPLIEFHYVTIHPDKEKLDIDDEPLEIYGVIEITNGKGDSFYLYNQPEDDTETMYYGDKLYLIDTRPMTSPFPVTKIYFYLMDKTKGLELANQTLTLDYTEKSITFEEEGDEYASGKDGFVNVRFTTFDAAVIANLDFQLCKKNDLRQSDNDGIGVVGTISASCECNYSFVKGFNAPLFYVGDEPVLVKCGESIPVFKSRMAVPACSSLTISVSFRDFICGVITCPAEHLGCATEEIKGSFDYFIKVDINWVPGNPRTEKLQTQLIDDDSPPPSSISRALIRPKSAADEFTEVYAIVIVPDEKVNSNEVLNLYGRVDFVAPSGEYCLLKIKKSRPISFRCDEVKKIIFDVPARYCGDYWSNFQVKLMDIEGHLFCEGFIAWDRNVDYGNIVSWYGKRLCSIIKGDYGLVKVYHSIFKAAVQATVTILSYFEDSSRVVDTNVSGGIFSSYGKYAYDSRYDKDHYRNVLFSESRGSCSKISIGRGEQLPLLKSVISVPIDSVLIIEVDLCTSLGVESPGSETLKGLAKFEVGYKHCWRLQRKDFFINVLVDWVPSI